VDGRLDVAVVRHLHGDLRALIYVQRRAWDRPVVCEHAHLGVADALAHGMDAQFEAIAVVKTDDARARRFPESCGFGRECVMMIHSLSFHGLSSIGDHFLVYRVAASHDLP